MNILLKKALITAEIKPGFLIEFNDQFVQVRSIDGADVTLEDGNHVALQYANNNVVKFMGEYKDRVCSILHSDYENILYILNTTEVEIEGQTITYMEAFKKGYDVSFSAKSEKILTNVMEGDPIILSSIKIIDSLKAYEPSMRTGTIIKKDGWHYKIKMNSFTRTVEAKREDFILAGRKDEIYMYHVVCPYCKR